MRPDQLAQLVQRAFDPPQVLKYPGAVLFEIIAENLVQQIALVFKVLINERFGDTGSFGNFCSGYGVKIFSFKQCFQ